MPRIHAVILALVVGSVCSVPVTAAQDPARPVIVKATMDDSGQYLTITGSGFGTAPIVTIDEQPVTVMPGATDTQVTVLTPDVLLTTPGTYRLTVVDSVRQVGAVFVVASRAAALVQAAGAVTVASTTDATAASTPHANSTLPFDVRPQAGGGTGLGLVENSGSPYTTAIGYSALAVNTGSSNTAAGYMALNHNTTGSENVATGYGALYWNTTGYDNTATGTNAMIGNATGYYNAALGASALFSNSSGYKNTAVGVSTLAGITTGHDNTALGFFAGLNATTGSNNIFLGSNVAGTASDANTIRIGNAGTQNKTFIAGIRGTTVSGGFPVVIDSNGQLGTADSSGNFGIGTTLPVTKLDIHQSFDATTGGLRVINAGQDRAVYLWADGANVSRLDSGATGAGDLAINAPDGGNVGIGTVPGAKLDIQQSADVATGGLRVMNAGQNRAIYLWADGSDVARLDSGFTGAGPLVINSGSGGNVGIGTTMPTHPLEMRSGAYVSAGGVWTNASSRTLKQDIVGLPLDAAVAALVQLAPVTYGFKASPDERHVGFIAEDVPELVAARDRKSLSPMDIVAVVTRVAQDQQATIAALQQANADLQKRVARLEALGASVVGAAAGKGKITKDTIQTPGDVK